MEEKCLAKVTVVGWLPKWPQLLAFPRMLSLQCDSAAFGWSPGLLLAHRVKLCWQCPVLSLDLQRFCSFSWNSSGLPRTNRTSLLENEGPRGAEISCPNWDHPRPVSLLQTLKSPNEFRWVWLRLAEPPSWPADQWAIINVCGLKLPSVEVMVMLQLITETITQVMLAFQPGFFVF